MSAGGTAPDWLAACLTPGVSLRGVGPQTFSVLAAQDAGAPYDRRAAGYDRLIGSRLYNRLVWGTAPEEYATFIAEALSSGPDGVALDLAAGSCLESAAAYARAARNVVVLDRSLAMLERGRARVEALAGAPLANVVYLQSDALALPFRTAAFATLLSHGALHLFADAEAAAGEWFRVLAPGGALRVSSLVLTGRRGDRWLALLARAGEIAAPRRPEAVAAALRAATGREPELALRGSFAYLGVDAPAG